MPHRDAIRFNSRNEAIQMAAAMAARDEGLYQDFWLHRDGRVYWVERMEDGRYLIRDREPARHAGDDVIRLDARGRYGPVLVGPI